MPFSARGLALVSNVPNAKPQAEKQRALLMSGGRYGILGDGIRVYV